MKIVLECQDNIDKTVYAEVTEEGMKDFLAWFVAFRHATQHGLHLTAFGDELLGESPLQSIEPKGILSAKNGGK